MLHNIMKLSTNLRSARGINRATCSRLYSNSTKAVEEDENTPIKFTTSAAAKKTIIPPMRKVDPNVPWYQPFAVVVSVAVFLIYFCILREENDVDSEFTKSLYERVKGMEKHQLLLTYKFNKEHGKSVDDIEKRLMEIEIKPKH